MVFLARAYCTAGMQFVFVKGDKEKGQLPAVLVTHHSSFAATALAQSVIDILAEKNINLDMSKKEIADAIEDWA